MDKLAYFLVIRVLLKFLNVIRIIQGRKLTMPNKQVNYAKTIQWLVGRSELRFITHYFHRADCVKIFYEAFGRL